MRSTVVLIALRVPLICAAALALLAPLGAFSFSPFRGMLEGLFDLSAWGAFWVGMASWLTAAACWLCALLTLNYGPRRIAGLQRTATDLEFRAFPWLGLAVCSGPLSVIAGVCAVSPDWIDAVVGSAVGCIVSLIAWVVDRALCPCPNRSIRRVLKRLWQWDSAGYRDNFTGFLLPGHWMAAQFALLFVSLWALVGFLKYYALLSGWQPDVLPTSLTYVILLIGLLALTLNGVAFYCDRYRIPVVFPCVVLLAVTSLVPGADQLVETLPGAAGPLAAPENVIAALPTPVVVCASGGGIAAAAWTSSVLSSLDRQSPGRFTSSLALISGASGGSVGAMHFAVACRSTGGCASSFERATRPSLDAAAWGLVGPDLLRALVPFAGAAFGDISRGWALEQAWDPGRELRTPLSAWPPRPALVFNATLVESGEVVGLSNIDLGPGWSCGLRPQLDFTVVGSARLSASFPFVTPTPRPRALGYHFADGGYYDNYGVGAAVTFLDQAYRKPAPTLPRRILLVEIRTSRTRSRPPAADPGMLFQWRSPAGTLLNVRDTAQRRHNDITLDLLTRALAARGIALERVQFEIPRDDVPLSWHLTAAQIKSISRDWSVRFEKSAETRAVAAFLAQR